MRNKIVQLAQSVWVIATAALLFRLSYLAYMAHLIPSAVLSTVPFQNEVGNVAAAIARGDGFCCLFRQPTGPTAWLAPVYPLTLAGIFRIFGTFTLPAFYCAVISNCVFSALATLPLFWAAHRSVGLPGAAAAGWIWAILPSGIILPFEWIWDTSLSVLFAAALLWATIRLKDSARRRDFAWYGLLWGVSLLTNPALGAVLPFLLGWLWYQQRSDGARALRLVLTTIAVVILTCLPWTARNYFQFHRFIPLRSNFPFEFWSGNNEIFDERSREITRITRYEQVHLYAELGESKFLAIKMHDALNFVRMHPALYAQLFGERIAATWLGTDSPLQDFERTDSPLARFLIVWNAITLCGMIVGLVRVYGRRRIYFVPLAAFPLVFPLTFYIAHTTLRHRHPCDPVLALLMAIAVVRISNSESREIV
jgi:hypothetical protein